MLLGAWSAKLAEIGQKCSNLLTPPPPNPLKSLAPQKARCSNLLSPLTGYRPSALARSLRTGRIRTVGLPIGDITDRFPTDVVARLQRELHRAGQGVMLCCNDRSAALQDEQIALLRGREVDGLIIAPVGDDAALRKALQGYGAPVVLIDRELPGQDCAAVLLGNRAAVADARTHLAGLGHRRPPARQTHRPRMAAGPPHGPGQGQDRRRSGAGAMRRFPAASNHSAIGTMKGLAALGRSCPGAVSLAAINEFPWADVFRAKLITVASQSLRRGGRRTAGTAFTPGRCGGSCCPGFRISAPRAARPEPPRATIHHRSRDPARFQAGARRMSIFAAAGGPPTARRRRIMPMRRDQMQASGAGARILIASESVFGIHTHFKGFASCETGEITASLDPVIQRFADTGLQIDFLPNHAVVQKFRFDARALAQGMRG